METGLAFPWAAMGMPVERKLLKINGLLHRRLCFNFAVKLLKKKKRSHLMP